MAESMEVVQENPLDMFDVLCDHKFADKRLNKMYEFLYDLLKKDPNCNLKDEYKDLVFKITEQRFECYIITRERERVAKVSCWLSSYMLSSHLTSCSSFFRIKK